MIVSLIAAYTEGERVIGRDGGMPWHLPRDLARFRRLTMGHTLLMGRRTLHSLQGRRLAGRRIILLSRSVRTPPANAAALAASLDEGLDIARGEFEESELFVAGGEQVYRQALQAGLVDRMYLTVVEGQVHGDTHFPPFDAERWQITEETRYAADEKHRFPLVFRTLERRDR